MDNGTIADLLDELGSLETVRGSNPFKARAYQRAATTLRALREPVAAVRQRGELRELDGFGEAIVAKVGELLDTGKLDALERARAEVGMDVATLSKLPGLGPKLLVELRDELNIRTLDDLEAALERGRLAKAKGIGPKLERRIRDALPLVRAAASSHRLDDARAFLNDLLDDGEPLGDTRRWMPSVGALVLGTNDPLDVVHAALAGRGLTVDHADRALVVKSGRRAARVVKLDPARDGRRLIELTGPSEHVAALQAHAAGDGVLWAMLTGKEADVYEAMGLAWIPPECRDDPRCIEQAAHGGFEQLIALKALQADLQVHTTFSDGTATPLEMAHAAKASGHTTLGLTDHAGHEGIPSSLKEGDIDAYVAAAHEAGDEAGLQVLAGAEVEVSRTGELTLRDQSLEQLDYVAAGIHLGLDLPSDQQTARYMAVVEHPLVSILVHPTGRKVDQRAGAKVDWDGVFAAAAGNDVVMEIDAHPARNDLDATLVRRAIAAGCDIAVDTDAHEPSELALLPYGVMTARKALVPRERVVNALGPDTLRARLAR